MYLIKFIKKKNSLLLLLIIGINLAVYFPALKHLPRADQVFFLMETVENDDLVGLIKQTYSYTRTRHYAPGDANQFKPLYFSILSLEKWLYGFKFVYWQLTNLCLHLFVVRQLYKILTFIHPGRFAGLIALSFSVLHIFQEMVIFDHMAPYLVFMILLLKAMRYFGSFIKEGQRENSLFFKMLACLSIACFIHEYVVVCIMVMAAVLFIDRNLFLKRKKGEGFVNIFWLFVPIIIYVSWSLIDYSLKIGDFSFVLSKNQASFSAIAIIFKIFILSILTPIIPSFLNMKFNERLFTKSFDLETIVRNFNPQDFWLNLNVLLVINLGFLLLILLKITFQNFYRGKVSFRKKLENNFHKSKLFIGIVSLLFSFLYICMITFGRFMERGIVYLQINLYYFYTIVLFDIIFFYSFYCWVDNDKKKRGLSKIFLIGIFSILIFLNGFYVFRLNLKMAQAVSVINKRIGLEVTPQQYYLSHKYVIQGVLEIGKNNDASAIVYCDQALRIDPKSYYTRMIKGVALVNMKQYEQAIVEFKKSLSFNLNHPNTYYNLGIAYMEQKKFNLAVENFSRAIQLKPDFQNAYTNRANIYCLYGRYERAVSDYTKVIEISPQDPMGYYNRAITYQDMNNIQQALKDAFKAKSLGLSEAETYVQELERLDTKGQKPSGWDQVLEDIRGRYADVAHISTEELNQWIHDKGREMPLIIDTREKKEYEVSHLPGAVWGGNNKKRVKKILENQGKRAAVLYCSVGERSANIAQWLEKQKFENIYNLEGSIFQWANKGYPVFKNSERVDKVHPFDNSWGKLLEKKYWNDDK